MSYENDLLSGTDYEYNSNLESMIVKKSVTLLPIIDYEKMSKNELIKESDSMQKLLDSIPPEKHNEVDGIESYKEDLIFIKNLLKNMNK